MTEPANNPIEPNPPADPTPAVPVVPAVDDGKPQPAASDGKTLLGADPAPADPKPADDPKPVGDDPAPVEGAPEKYDFKAPEGKEYDPNLLGSFSEAAKEANLSQEAAQKVIDKMAPVLATRQAEQVQAIQTEWIEASKADKEFGGEKFQENMAVAKKGYDTFASPELRQLLEQTGLGNHPEVIRHFVHVGKAISEDKFVTGGAAVADSQENRFYKTMKDKK